MQEEDKRDEPLLEFAESHPEYKPMTLMTAGAPYVPEDLHKAVLVAFQHPVCAGIVISLPLKQAYGQAVREETCGAGMVK